MTAIIYNTMKNFDKFIKEGLKKETDADVYDLYNATGIKKLFLGLFFVFFKRLFNKILVKKAKKIKGYDNVIWLVGKGITEELADIIKRNNNGARLILYFWNKIHNYTAAEYYQKNGWEIWSFEKSDCEKYNFKFSNSFYPITKKVEKNLIKRDFFFVGYDKGRLNLLNELQSKICDENLQSKIIVRKQNKFSPIMVFNHKQKNGIIITYKATSYSKIIKYVKQSSCIIDFSTNNQSGLTMRVYEAIVFQKKLITNNLNITEMPFYKKENILVYDKNITSTQIKKWIDIPYNSIDQEYVNEYTISSWFKRFSVE